MLVDFAFRYNFIDRFMGAAYLLCLHSTPSSRFIIIIRRRLACEVDFSSSLASISIFRLIIFSNKIIYITCACRNDHLNWISPQKGEKM